MSFVGSPAYASPEQCELDDLDTRSDIYSLGGTLWYLLTGKPPFTGNVNQVLIAHATKTPPFGQLTGVPQPVIGLLRRMLAKSPDDRPKDPQALQEAIVAIEAQLAGDSWRTPEGASSESSGAAAESLGSAGAQENSGAPETVVSPLLDVYQRVEAGVLVAERYRLIEEQTEGNCGRLFLAHDEKAGRGDPAQVALKLVHPEIAPQFLDLLKEEIEVIKVASHPNLLAYSGPESAASGLFIVREWVHGFLLYDLLRLRRSLKPEEVMAVLEPLPATLDFVSDARAQDRVSRGSSWNHYTSDSLLASYRISFAPYVRRANVGFRCVVAVDSSR
jgi:serine/threonine protein kinase